MNITWMILSGAGLLFVGHTLIFRKEILSSPLARAGGGLYSYFTGRGINAGALKDSTEFTVSEGMVWDGLDEEGRPIPRGTRSIHHRN